MKLDPATAAILTLDCQQGIVDMLAGAERIFRPAARVLCAARSSKLTIVHVGLGFRPGYPEVPADHPTFGRIRESGRFVTGSDSAAFLACVAPQPGEIVVAKHRVSAFSGNDLEMILRSLGIKDLIFFGIATSGIVLSTLRQAADMDFRCVVVKDCCFDADDEVHRVLTEKVFVRQAAVVDADTLISGML